MTRSLDQIAESLVGVTNLDRVNPEAWSRTYGGFVTADQVAELVRVERARRKVAA